MSIDASLTRAFADGDYRFRLAIGELRQLQEKLESGPVEIFDRLLNRTWRLDDLRETIRLALIGGGQTPAQALKLVRDYVDARPPLENIDLAQEIIAAAMIGPPDEDLGNAAPVETATGPQGGSSSPASMAPAPQ